MEKEFYDYIYNTRISGLYHFTREAIRNLFYRVQTEPEARLNPVKFFFSKLSGEPGVLDENEITHIRYTILNCCFYYCDFLLDYNVDSELVYVSSDYFINKVSKIKTAADANKLLGSIMEASMELIRKKSEKKYPPKIEACMRFISQKLYSQLSLADAADYMKMTPQHLTTLFKKETGKSLYEYVRERKIEEAKCALKYTSNSITIIADALGYNSIGHFSNAFKAVTGMTPSKFRLLKS
jgi:AraC-like DNA-binding protein